MSKSYFITGTGTDVGKTLVASGLLAAAAQQGMSTVGLKPVAAGCTMTEDGLRNDDALKLLAHTSLSVSYEQVNPVALAPPIAPHIAAAEAGRRLNADRLVGICRGVLIQRPDFAVIEGAGGWRVPLNERETFADLAKILQLPVILVVGMELGCINQAILTAEAIRHDGLGIAGWVANRVSAEMTHYEENLVALKRWIPAPLLADIPFMPSAEAEQIRDFMKLETLLS